MTRVLALADQSKIGCITQRRFAKVGTKTHPQRGADLDRNGLSVSTETACRFEPKSAVGNSEICISNRLFLGGLLPSRARFRFTGHRHSSSIPTRRGNPNALLNSPAEMQPKSRSSCPSGTRVSSLLCAPGVISILRRQRKSRCRENLHRLHFLDGHRLSSLYRTRILELKISLVKYSGRAREGLATGSLPRPRQFAAVRAVIGASR